MLPRMHVTVQGLGRRAPEGTINLTAMFIHLCRSDTTPSAHPVNVHVGFPADWGEKTLKLADRWVSHIFTLWKGNSPKLNPVRVTLKNSSKGEYSQDKAPGGVSAPHSRWKEGGLRQQHMYCGWRHGYMIWDPEKENRKKGRGCLG